jgi:predicted transposase YdaD
MLGITLKETRVYQEARQDEARSLILRQLNRRVGAVSDGAIERVNGLAIDQLESLGEALLDFATVDDLTAWLQENERGASGLTG